MENKPLIFVGLYIYAKDVPSILTGNDWIDFYETTDSVQQFEANKQ